MQDLLTMQDLLVMQDLLAMQDLLVMQDLLAMQDRPVAQEVLLERAVLDLQGQAVVAVVAATAQAALLVLHHPAKAVEKFERPQIAAFFFANVC